MPNWVDNNLTVLGPTEEVEAFMAAASADIPLSFNRFVPMPPELAVPAPPYVEGPYRGADLDLGMQDSDELRALHERNIARYGFAHWYDWCRKNWGTKWEPVFFEDPTLLALTQGEASRSVVTYRFRTAWNPPGPALGAMSERFPDLTFLLWFNELVSSTTGHVLATQGQAVNTCLVGPGRFADDTPEPDDLDSGQIATSSSEGRP